MSIDSNSAANQLRVFGMRNLMLEVDLAKLETRGIEIGHALSKAGAGLVDTELFEADIRRQARKMADFYCLYYSLENSIRRLISGRLQERYGADWWSTRVPSGVISKVEEIQRKEKDTPMSIRSENPLTYTSFGELIDILNSNWTDFSDTLRSQKSTQLLLSQLNQIRNLVAHSVELNDDEILRFQLLIRDWFRITG